MNTRTTRGLLWLATVASSAAALPFMPERVPVHWGLSGRPDRWGSRWELLLLGPGLLLLIGGLLWLVDRADPVERPGDDQEPKKRVGTLAMGLMAALHVVILAHVTGLVGDLTRGICMGMSLFWMLMGNEMGRVKPNASTGIRTPWTFSSPEIWRRTHRLAAQLMALAGLLGLLGSLVLSGPVLLVLVLALVLVSTLGPAAYSYVLFRRQPPA